MTRRAETHTGDAQAAALAVLRHAEAVAAGDATGPASAVDGDAALAIDPGTIRAAFDRLLVQRLADRGLDVLQASGWLSAVLPEVEAMVGFSDTDWHHKDVWRHTKQVVVQADPHLAIRWAALLHDVGKVKTRRILKNGEVHFFGHAEVGASMFERICRRLPFEDDLRSRIRFLILHHLRANQYEPSWTDSAVRRFDREMGDWLDDLLALSRADITTKRPDRRRKGLKQIDELWRRIETLRIEDAKVPPLPKGLGDEIMRAFSLSPGPKIGELRRRLEASVDAGELEAQREAEYYVEHLRKIGID